MDSTRPIRIAAIADLHVGQQPNGTLVGLFAGLDREADVLCLCGDLTDRGRPEEAIALVEELAGVSIPIVAVLGNHDHESEAADEVAAILTDRGIHLLDGEAVVVSGVGFAGVKGFGGGFGRYTIGSFGERLLKEFVRETLDEVLKLESALRSLTTRTKIALMHFSPIAETLVGEPEQLYPFLGSSRFLPVVEAHGASVVFHGHAHFGTLEGVTPGGIEVYNVARPILEKLGRRVHIWSGRAPERREASD